MNMRISLLTPTRKRPQRLREMIDSVKATANEFPEILCYVAHDDDSYDSKLFPEVTIIRGERVTFSDTWNALIPFATGDIFMQAADDILFRDKGWDILVKKAYVDCWDKILCVYADDGSPNGKNFATLPFVSRRWTEILGYFTGPGFSADFSDAWPQDVADMIGRKKYIPALIEHMHPLWNKAERDETYRDNEARNRRDNNTQKYIDRLPERIRDAEKLREEIRRCAAQS
jgi:glycosyltransferase involved in cell wall biosynthesis